MLSQNLFLIQKCFENNIRTYNKYLRRVYPIEVLSIKPWIKGLCLKTFPDSPPSGENRTPRIWKCNFSSCKESKLIWSMAKQSPHQQSRIVDGKKKCTYVVRMRTTTSEVKSLSPSQPESRSRSHLKLAFKLGMSWLVETMKSDAMEG